MNLRHETFISEMIAHGNRRQAYLSAYPTSSPDAAYNNACRLLTNPQIRNRISNVVLATEQETIAQLQQERAVSLAETYEKRVLLARIIKAALEPEQEETNCNHFGLQEKQNECRKETKSNPKETIRNKRKQAETIPTVSQVLRAIVLDTKLEYGWKRKL